MEQLGSDLSRPRWFFNRDGTAAKAPAAASAKGNCDAETTSPVMGDALSHPDYYRKVPAYKDFNPTCGVVLQLNTLQPGPTGSAFVTLVDNVALLSAIVDGHAYLSAQTEAERAQEAASAKKQALPKL